MKVDAKRVNQANVAVEASVTKKTLDSKIDNIAKKAAKQMKVDGFRSGKVPVTVIKQRLGERLLQDAEAECLRDILNHASQYLEIDAARIIGEPAVSKFDRHDEGIDIAFRISLKPEFEAGGYQELVPEFEMPQIGDEEVEERINQMAEASAPFHEVQEDRSLQDGDLAVFDFEGFLNGEPFAGGKAENYELRIGSNQFIPGFEEQMVGMRKEERKTVTVTFPEDYGNKELAGNAVNFALHLHTIKAKGDAVIDNAFAQRMSGKEDATLESFKEEIKEQIKSEKLSKLYNDELKPKLVEALVAHYTFDLPENVVEQEVELALRGRVQQMNEEELKSLREDEEALKTLRETLKEDAAKSVKATFIIDTISRIEGIDVGEQEMMQAIYYEAMSSGQDPQQMMEYYKKQNLLPAIKMAMTEDRLLSKLLNSKVEVEAS